MHIERIDVISYSGRIGNERPVTFALRGLRIDVVEVLDHWLEESLEDRVLMRYFEVKGSDGIQHRIRYDEASLEWQHLSP